MVLPRRLKKKVRKTLVFFVNFTKRLITMQKNVGTKASLNVTFEKCIGHVEKDCWHKKREQAFFVKIHEEEREENLFFASKSNASTKRNEWYVDSGCSNHMTRDEKAFLSINNNITTKVKTGNGALVDAKGKGTILINIKGSG